MSSVENTIGSGLSKIQETLDKSKNKVVEMKEVSKINKTIEDLNIKKSELLLEIGIDTYKKVRAGIIQDDEIAEKCKRIVGFDYILYDNKKKLDVLKKEAEGFACSCGNKLTYEDKFCGDCGKKVEIPVEDESDTIICNNCEMEINYNVNFCTCCGIKID